MAFAEVRGLERFLRDVGTFEAEIPERLVTLQRAVALQVLTGVVPATPVDTGRARGNWVVAHGSSPSGETGTLDPSGSLAIARGQAEIAAIRPFESTYVSNDVPYIVALEEGRKSDNPNWHGSRQGRGFVAATVARVNAQFQEPQR